ncbi:hypothetical protein EDC04DRAFT_2899873 [Pisolithus marmoratus]|nr:hypothetical protein EDC04DRAFT_2899873 [Pisolithus marmoratus]
MPTIVRHFLSRLLAGLGMSSQSPTQVDCLFQDTLGFCTAKLWETIIRRDDNASRCFVEKVIWHKQSSIVQHEFLEINILSVDGRHTSIVLAERGKDHVPSDITRQESVTHPGTLSHTKNSVNKSPSINPIPAVNPLADSSPSLDPPAGMNPTPSAGLATLNDNILFSLRSCKLSIGEADDVVSAATLGTPGATNLLLKCSATAPLRTLTFPRGTTRPSAHDISTLLAVTSNHILVYNAMESQCYWFSETVFKALKSLFVGAREEIHSSRAGRWRGVSIPTAESVEAIMAEWDQALVERDRALVEVAAQSRALAEALARQAQLEAQLNQRAGTGEGVVGFRR